MTRRGRRSGHQPGSQGPAAHRPTRPDQPGTRQQEPGPGGVVPDGPVDRTVQPPASSTIPWRLKYGGPGATTLRFSLIMLDLDHFKSGQRPVRPSAGGRGAHARGRHPAVAGTRYGYRRPLGRRGISDRVPGNHAQGGRAAGQPAAPGNRPHRASGGRTRDGQFRRGPAPGRHRDSDPARPGGRGPVPGQAGGPEPGRPGRARRVPPTTARRRFDACPAMLYMPRP